MSVPSRIDSFQPKVPKIHALIIGINKYKQSRLHPDLEGCVSDAQCMLRYFTDLGIPEDHLLCLYNEHATRDAILNAFMNHLINNPDIKPFDPIVIYFAGYGNCMPTPKSWKTTDGVVGMILPHDASTIDEKQCHVYGIPEPTLVCLLYKLSQEKGNNITVILDSSQSGRSTRKFRSRSSHDPNAPPIPDTLDRELRKSLSVDCPTEAQREFTLKRSSTSFMAPSLETHILLAACKSQERAQEITNKDPDLGDTMDPEASGVFTRALLEELRKCDLATTSYASLIRRLLAAQALQGMRSQTFQCEGRNRDRLLFSVQNSILKRDIGLVQTSEKGVYRVNIGSAQGVVPGTEFGVLYPDSESLHVSGRTDLTSTPRMILAATEVDATVSQLRNLRSNDPPETSIDAYVTILRYNDPDGVRIWVDEAVREDKFWQDVLMNLDPLSIVWATSRINHSLELSLSNGDLELRGAHWTPGQFGGPHTLKRTMRSGELVDRLDAIVYFYFNLKVRNDQAPVRDKLGIALRELKGGNTSERSPLAGYEAKGGDLFGGNVLAGTVATLHADLDKVFGLKITNNFEQNLFPYVLYYDFEDYSVGSLYEPPGRSIGAPLLAGASMTIGYGPGTSSPFQVDFTNLESEKEYGAFVLLVFSEWVDLACFLQDSPLMTDSFGNERRCTEYRPGIWDKLGWDSLVARIEMVKGK
ncbi:unnamed protein product [Rhizoctonia solani]|uniref:Peptidase C14 caspase domain-containing protein n=1 Tax=Rhizoctonia solani TaxID=456999 RepID=A0A8H2WN60_9AGAM|nr:unnamed protein product [Rhizoctonia solani]